jgi:transcriptional regulator with XRE-family HTH domain
MDHKIRTKAPDACDADVGRRIRAQRLVCHMSQTELGNRVGITFQQIQKYEKGVNRVGAGRLARIAEVLSVPVAFFFSGDQRTTDTTENINSGLSFLESAGAVRLVRAYSQIEDPQIRRALVDLAEEVAGHKTRKPSKHANLAGLAELERAKPGRGRSLKANASRPS